MEVGEQLERENVSSCETLYGKRKADSEYVKDAKKVRSEESVGVENDCDAQVKAMKSMNLVTDDKKSRKKKKSKDKDKLQGDERHRKKKKKSKQKKDKGHNDDETARKKKKKSKDNNNDENCFHSVTEKKLKKSKKCRKNPPENSVQVSGLVVDALFNIFDHQKRKKKKRSKNMEQEQPLADAEIRDEDSMSQLECDFETCEEWNSFKKDVDNGENHDSTDLPSTPTRTKKKKKKLASMSDLNLLSNPDDVESDAHESHNTTEEMDEYILPDPNVSSLAVYGNAQVTSAASVSWHVPETLPETPQNSRNESVKRIARTAVAEVLAEEGMDDSGSGKKRRSIVNYELLCKTILKDPCEVLQESPNGIGTDENLTKENNYDESIINDDKTQVLSPESSPSANDPLATRIVTIKDLYRMPKRHKVPPVLYEACKFIFHQFVEVSELNIAYTGHCVPREKEYRGILRRKYGAKFGKYYEEQDLMLTKRFNTLVQHGVVEDKEEFCHFLNIYCNGKDQAELMKSTRNIGIRNIVGLFIGQDIPHKIAAVNCMRFIKLVLGGSYLFPSREKLISSDIDKITTTHEEQSHDDLIMEDERDEASKNSDDVKPRKKRRVQNWTCEEDRFLVDWIVGGDGGTRVEDVDTMKVDWEGVADALERGVQNVREHWCRVVQPILVEDVEPEAILSYRLRLLKEISSMGVMHRKDIDWNYLAKKFHPRTTYAIQANFSDLVKGGKSSRSPDSSEEFRDRMRQALAKLNRMTEFPEEKLNKFIKRSSYRRELRDYYWEMIG